MQTGSQWITIVPRATWRLFDVPLGDRKRLVVVPVLESDHLHAVPGPADEVPGDVATFAGSKKCLISKLSRDKTMLICKWAGFEPRLLVLKLITIHQSHCPNPT